MKKKSLLLMLLLCIAFAVGGILSACGNDGSRVELVDFENETITVDLGSTYTISDTFVKDTEGNNYRLTVTVKDSAGEEISVLANQFAVEDPGGYVITFSADLGGGDVRTRTVTLNVQDKGDPTITISSPQMGYVNEEYVLPSVSVRDDSGESLTPEIKVYLVNGEDREEQTITDGKFTPATRGEYLIEASATDSSGNTGTASATFYVRNALTLNTFEDFNDPYSVSSIVNVDRGYTEKAPVYHETFEGATGVASTGSIADQYGTYEYFKFNMTTEELAELDFYYVYVKCYIAYDGTDRTAVDLFNWNYGLGNYPLNEWIEVRLTAEDIERSDVCYSDPNIYLPGESPRDCFNRLMTVDGGYLFWIRNGGFEKDSGKDLYTFYVDEIGFKRVYEPVMSTPSEVELGDTVTLEGTVADLTDYTLSYQVVDPFGKTVQLTDNNTFDANIMGEYKVTVTVNHATEGGAMDFVITVGSDTNIAIGDFTDTPSIGGTVTIPAGTLDGAQVNVSVVWSGTEITVNDGTFTANNIGEYIVTYTAVKDGLTYINTLTITVVAPEERPDPAVNEVESFDHPDSDSSLMGFNGSYNEVRWLNSYEGEAGVVELSYGGSAWPAFSFVPRRPMADYADYDYLVIRAYIVSGGNAYTSMILGNDTVYVTHPLTSIQTDRWVDYVYEIDNFLYWWKDEGTDTLKARIWSGQTDATDGVIYIAEIMVYKNLDDAQIDVNVTGTLIAGQSATVEVTAADGFNVSSVITAPDGSVVTPASGGVIENLAEGTYTVTVSVSDPGYMGTYEETFVVAPATGYKLVGELEDSYAAGAQIEVPDMSLINSLTQETLVAVMDYTVNYYGDPVTVTDGAFTADLGGTYTVVYTTTYNETPYTTSVEITVNRPAPAAGEVESFSDRSSIDNVSMRSAGDPIYVDDTASGPADATHGYVKFEITQGEENWPVLRLQPRQGVEAYADYDYIRLTIRIVGTAGTVQMCFWPGDAERVTVPLNEWITVDVYAVLFRDLAFDTLTSPDQGWFWFTNVSGNSVQEFHIYDVTAIKDETPPTEVGTVVTFDSEDKLDNIYVGEASEAIKFYDAEAIAASEGDLPTLDGDDTGYVEVKNGNAQQWFNVRITPECNFGEFSQYDYISIKMYITGEGTIPIYYYNNEMADITRGQWVEFVMPLSIYMNSHHQGKAFYIVQQLFDDMSKDKLFMLSGGGEYNLYIASIDFYTPETDESLGNNFTELTTENVTVNSGSVEAVAEFEGKSDVLKITSTNTWVNIFVKPGKTWGELDNYSKVSVTVYIEADANVELYSQAILHGATGNDFFSYGSMTPGEWHTFDIEISRIKELYAGLFLGNNALMIDRGHSFTAIYIAEIVCVA